MLLCRARMIVCALPLLHVVETMRPLRIQRLGSVPPFVLGLSIIRGTPVPVVDMGVLLGADAAAAPTRFITLRTADRLVALAVEEVVGVRELPAASIRSLPPLLDRIRPRVIARVGMRDRNLLVVLGDVRIVPDTVWDASAPS